VHAIRSGRVGLRGIREKEQGMNFGEGKTSANGKTLKAWGGKMTEQQRGKQQRRGLRDKNRDKKLKRNHSSNLPSLSGSPM